MLGDDNLRIANVFWFHRAARISANFGARADNDDHFCTGVEDMDVRPMSALVPSIDPDFESSDLAARHGS